MCIRDRNSRFDINQTKLNKRFDINDDKFDVLTKSLCSIEDRMNAICREIKESREGVCVGDNKTNENCRLVIRVQ